MPVPFPSWVAFANLIRLGRFAHPIKLASRGLLVLALLLTANAASMAVAQEEPVAVEDTGEGPKKIYEKEPFDRITLDDVNKNAVLIVRPVKLPDRKLPVKPKPGFKIKVKLFDDDRDFELAWHNIDKFELFEQMILAEANQLAADKKLDEAYPYFVFLLNTYPNTEGLVEGRQAYLYLSAGAAFKQQKFAEALGILEELHSLNSSFRLSPTSPPLMNLLGSTADKILESYVRKEDFRTARTLLVRLEKAYAAKEEPFSKKWRGKLSELAQQHLEEGKRQLEAGNLLGAYDACARMNNVWREVAGGDEFRLEVARKYPVIRVGVSQPALQVDSRSLTSHASRRVGRLLERRLLEFEALGSDGGAYRSPLGKFSISDDGSQLLFHLNPAPANGPHRPLSGPELAQHLLTQASPDRPEYQPSWARLMASVRVLGSDDVQVDLRVSHVHPDPFLQTNYAPVLAEGGAPSSDLTQPGSGPFALLDRKENVSRYTQNLQYLLKGAQQPGEVTEIVYDDPTRSLLALERGEIDILDQVLPSDIADLRKNSDLVVAAYMAPNSHFLAVRSNHPYLHNRTFRRALVYGLNREAILKSGILKESSVLGFRVISVPFPAPKDSADGSAYGYDDRITPRPYDPPLALTLRVLSEREIKGDFEKRNQPVPPLTPLTLGHPADEVSRIACRAIARQWKSMQVECKLVQFPPGVTADLKEECDLVYMQVAAWEPIADAGRLFGPNGLLPTDNSFVGLTLRQIESAKNWPEARRRLQSLHRLLHEDVTVLPLWQTYDHFAYRKGLVGLAPPRASLYQDIEQWQVVPPPAKK